VSTKFSPKPFFYMLAYARPTHKKKILIFKLAVVNQANTSLNIYFK